MNLNEFNYIEKDLCINEYNWNMLYCYNMIDDFVDFGIESRLGFILIKKYD